MHIHTMHTYTYTSKHFHFADPDGLKAFTLPLYKHNGKYMFFDTHITSFPLFKAWRHVYFVENMTTFEDNRDLQITVIPISNIECRRYELHAFELRMTVLSRTRGREVKMRICKKEGEEDEKEEKKRENRYIEEEMGEYQCGRDEYIMYKNTFKIKKE